MTKHTPVLTPPPDSWWLNPATFCNQAERGHGTRERKAMAQRYPVPPLAKAKGEAAKVMPMRKVK